MCLLAAPAERRDLLEPVRQLTEALRAREQPALEIRHQAIADDRNLPLVDDMREGLDLLRTQELRLVDDDDGFLHEIDRLEPLEKTRHQLALRVQPDA